jgi:hypothetical protein
MDQANFIINLGALTLAVPLQACLLVRFRFKLDPSALFVMFTYLAVMLSRVFADKSNYSILDMINPICSTLIWGALLFFTFEMRYI